MKLFYVMGGGWGHLYRVRTFINQFSITGIKVLTNNPLAGKLFLQEEIIHVQGESRDEVITRVQNLVASLDFEELYIDTFPAGLFGELNGLVRSKVTYLARRLKWNNYSPLVNHGYVQFQETFCFEELEIEHENFLSEVSSSTVTLRLQYPDPNPDRIPRNLIPTGRPIWLVVHSFDKDEVYSLLNYAKDIARMENLLPTFIVLSDLPIEDNEAVGYTWLPASDWFPLAEKIFTGGGFNVMQQVMPFKHKVVSIPFPRKFDDQGWRIRHHLSQPG